MPRPTATRDGESVWAVVVAGGSGTRFGGPKQFAVLAGETVAARALSAVAAVADGIVIVVPGGSPDGPDGPSALEAAGLSAEGPPAWGPIAVVAGGSTRAASVRAGLSAVPEACDIVVVHDAARPLASEALCRSVVEAVRAGADGAVPGVALSDTVKRVAGSVVVETLERDQLVAVQTPQAFRAAVLRSAHEGRADATDDAALVEAVGGQVVVVPGEPHNLKVTTPEDLDLAEWWFSRLCATGPEQVAQ